MRLEIVDWFCGAGGASSGAGEHRVVFGVDSDKVALDAFRRNFPAAGAKVKALPCSAAALNAPKCDSSSFWWMSPPCTAFSSAKRSCEAGEKV